MPSDAPTLERRRIFADRSLVGAVFCRAYSRRVDEWLAGVFAEAGGQGRQVALVAVGGYGRAELSPQSDLDLLLLHESADDVSDLAGALWYPVWNEGLKLGHAVRTVSETLKLARSDLDTATALLSLRRIAGDRALADRLGVGAREQWSRRARTWLPRLVEDARRREAEHGAVAFRLQPDLKESTGGARDVQALGFVALARPELADPGSGMLRAAYETLLAARVELHRATGNARNLLTLEVQSDVAKALGHQSVEEFMTEIAAAGRTVGWVADEAWASVERWATPRRILRRRSATTLEPGVLFRHDRNEVQLAPEAPVAGRPVAGAARRCRGRGSRRTHRARIGAAAGQGDATSGRSLATGGAGSLRGVAGLRSQRHPHHRRARPGRCRRQDPARVGDLPESPAAQRLPPVHRRPAPLRDRGAGGPHHRWPPGRPGASRPPAGGGAAARHR